MTTTRRYLFVIHYPVFGGPHNQALRLAGPLAASGWETVVLLPDEPGNSADRLRDAGIEVVTAPLSRIRATADVRRHLQMAVHVRTDVADDPPDRARAGDRTRAARRTCQPPSGRRRPRRGDCGRLATARHSPAAGGPGRLLPPGRALRGRDHGDGASGGGRSSRRLVSRRPRDLLLPSGGSVAVQSGSGGARCGPPGARYPRGRDGHRYGRESEPDEGTPDVSSGRSAAARGAAGSPVPHPRCRLQLPERVLTVALGRGRTARAFRR